MMSTGASTSDIIFDYLVKMYLPDLSIVKSLFFPLGLISIEKQKPFIGGMQAPLNYQVQKGI